MYLPMCYRQYYNVNSVESSGPRVNARWLMQVYVSLLLHKYSSPPSNDTALITVNIHTNSF